MDENNGSTIKLLVDTLSKSLQNLSDKITSYQPILNHIDTCEDKELLQINDIINYCSNLSKVLDTTANDFYNKLNNITESVNTVKTRIEKVPENIKDEHASIFKKIEELENNIKNEIDELKEEFSKCNESISGLKKDIEPVSKLSDMINKPLGFLIFIIGLVLASITIVNGVGSVIDYYKTSKQNYQTYISSPQNSDTIK